MDDLRESDAPNSRGLSWKRTAIELIWQSLNVPKWEALKNTPHFIVRLGPDGAVQLQDMKSKSLSRGAAGPHTRGKQITGTVNLRS